MALNIVHVCAVTVAGLLFCNKLPCNVTEQKLSCYFLVIECKLCSTRRILYHMCPTSRTIRSACNTQPNTKANVFKSCIPEYSKMSCPSLIYSRAMTPRPLPWTIPYLPANRRHCAPSIITRSPALWPEFWKCGGGGSRVFEYSKSFMHPFSIKTSFSGLQKEKETNVVCKYAQDQIEEHCKEVHIHSETRKKNRVMLTGGNCQGFPEVFSQCVVFYQILTVVLVS